MGVNGRSKQLRSAVALQFLAKILDKKVVSFDVLLSILV